MSEEVASGCTGACPSSPQLQIYQTIIFATPVLLAFTLLLMICLFYFRRQSRAAALRSHSQHITTQYFADSFSVNTASAEQGLSKSFRQKLPVIFYNETFSSTCQDSQCAVCLGDYQLDEKLQQLPLCRHSFHAHCIDEWLAKNATCPICRASFQDCSITGGDAFHETVEIHGADDSRLTWERRVVGEIQDQHHSLRFNTLFNSGETSDEHAETLSDQDVKPTIEHLISIERS